MSFFSRLFGGSKSNEDSTGGSIQVLSADEFKQRIQKEKPLRLIDVRTPSEFKSGHIQGAQNIDVMNPGAFDQKLSGMNKQGPVFVYCRSGQRSRSAARRMLKLGFEEIYDLKGGITAWK